MSESTGGHKSGPSCARHGPMDLRPTNVQTREQQWCGTWYDCGRLDCRTSYLLPSTELEEGQR